MTQAAAKASFELLVDSSQADRALEQTRGKVLAFKGGINNLKEGADKLDQGLSKIEKSTKGLAGAVGGLGGKFGDAYGAMADMAMAFASGGIMAVGLAAGTAAVGLLSSKLEEMHRKSMDADKAFSAAIQASAKLRDEQVAASKSRIESLELELKTIGKTPAQAVRVQAEYEQNKLFEEYSSKVKALNAVNQKIRAAIDDQLNNKGKGGGAANEEAALTERDIIRAEIATLEQRIRDIDQRADKEVALADAIDKARKLEEKRTKAIEDQKKKLEERNRLNEEFERNMREMARERESSRWAEMMGGPGSKDWEAKQKAWEQQAKLEQDAMAQRKQRLAEQQRMQEAAAKAEIDTRRQVAEQSLGIAVAGIETLQAAMVAGDENAFAVFQANVMRQAGQALVGAGVRATAEGIVQVLGGNPGGAGAIGVGLGMISVGVGLGGAAGGIDKLVADARAINDEADLPKGTSVEGASAPKYGSETSSAGITIVNNYGLGVPQEKAGRDVEQLFNFMRRQGMRV